MADVILVDGKQDASGIVNPLAYRPDHTLRNERIRPGSAGQIILGEFVKALAVSAASGQRNSRLEARGNDRADLRALPLDQRVCAERCRIPHRVHSGQHRLAIQAELATCVVERLIESLGEVWCVVSAFAWMYWPSQAKKQSVKVPPMSTEIRFMSRSLSAHVGVDVAAERDRGAGGTSRPLRLQRVHVDFHVEDRRMPGRQVLSLDQRSAARAVELQDPAPGGIGCEREFV